MSQPCRMWNFSIACVLTLTVTNVLLTVRLLHSGECSSPAAANAQLHTATASAAIDTVPHAPPLPRPSAPRCVLLHINGSNHSQLWPGEHRTAVFADINLHLGRWDARRLYKIFDHALVGDRFVDVSQNYSVCLATQTSLERMHELVRVAEQWTGPLSVAVFAAGNDELHVLQLYVTYLRHCYVSVRERITFHVVLPGDRLPSDVLSEIRAPFDCTERPERALQDAMRLRSDATAKWRLRNAYPQNHLRNVARKGCQSEHVFLIDVDIVPSNGFAEQLEHFVRTQPPCEKCAYVVPTYELDPRAKFPADKAAMVRLSRKLLARPFHHKAFIYNQFATNITRWEAEIPRTEKPKREDSNAISNIDAEFRTDTHISHNVTNFEFFYEPFYVSSDRVPEHDERFLGYGFTRNTQVYEMFLAGYRFVVLSPLFTCHWGMQNGKNPAWRERQNRANSKQFGVFKREVFARYQRDPLNMVVPAKAQQQRNGISALVGPVANGA